MPGINVGREEVWGVLPLIRLPILAEYFLCERIQKYIPDFIFLDAPVGKDPDQRNYIVSNVKVEALGFETMHSLDFGIQELIKGFTMIRNDVYGNI